MKHSEKSSEIGLSAPHLAGLMRDVLAKGASFRFRTKGFSMAPLVKDGDIITVSPCPAAKLRTGDIAAFTNPADDRLVVHRIVGTRGELLFIKGDNVPSVDGLVQRSRVLGRITRIERNGRDVRLGLGAERKMFAFLSRLRVLPLLVLPARKLYRLWAQRTPVT